MKYCECNWFHYLHLIVLGPQANTVHGLLSKIKALLENWAWALLLHFLFLSVEFIHKLTIGLILHTSTFALHQPTAIVWANNKNSNIFMCLQSGCSYHLEQSTSQHSRGWQFRTILTVTVYSASLTRITLTLHMTTCAHHSLVTRWLTGALSKTFNNNYYYYYKLNWLLITSCAHIKIFSYHPVSCPVTLAFASYYKCVLMRLWLKNWPNTFSC